jgi:hypothetical protein
MDPKQRLALLVLEALLGHRIQLLRFRPTAAGGPAVGGAPQVHQRTEIHSESEQTSFQARGTVETGSGRTITFEVTLTMQRAYQAQTTTTSANTMDPLVVNFAGGRPD